MLHDLTQPLFILFLEVCSPHIGKDTGTGKDILAEEAASRLCLELEGAWAEEGLAAAVLGGEAGSGRVRLRGEGAVGQRQVEAGAPLERVVDLWAAVLVAAVAVASPALGVVVAVAQFHQRDDGVARGGRLRRRARCAARSAAPSVAGRASTWRWAARRAARPA